MDAADIKARAEQIIITRDPGDGYGAIQDLVNGLKSIKQFGLGRQVAEIALASPQLTKSAEDERWLRQQQALCTYKDEEEAAESRLRDALPILLGPGKALDDPNWDAETLSLAGAIYKRLWEVTGQRRELDSAGVLYARAVTAGETAGNVGGWTYAAINAAFVFDRVASDMENGVAACGDKESLNTIGLTVSVENLRLEAAAFRQKILDHADALLKKADGHWWGYATLAEANLGLGHYGAASKLMAEAMAKAKADDWERESTARQLAALIEFRGQSRFAGHDPHKAMGVLANMGLEPQVVKALPLGKVGLALSGGGYRASLYHVGVLARLAEMDLLRWIDTLSCVSGGSVTGALYYLVLRGQLKVNETLSRDDYIKIVETVARLLTATAGAFDLRTRAFLRACSSCNTSMTDEIGRLLEEHLFHPAAGTSSGKPIALTDLLVTPKNDPARDGFNPRLHNWRRQDRVPMLVLNATTLNTGHNWQFTASWAGEPPTCIDTRVDASRRLRRFYLKDPTAPTRHKPPTLGQAVAASACIPLFPPIALDGLYPDHKVRLIDGGVHDNQGVFSLEEQGCAVMVISDGSGQLQSEISPSCLAPKVVWRSNDILMQAGRRSLFQMADIRKRGNRLRDLVYIHMKKGIEEPDVTWTGGKPPPAPVNTARTKLNPDVQQILAETRTDLDIFPETLAKSLMYAGYVLSTEELTGTAFAALANTADPGHNWSFMTVAENAAAPTPDYLCELRPRHNLFVRTLQSVWSDLKQWCSS